MTHRWIRLSVMLLGLAGCAQANEDRAGPPETSKTTAVAPAPTTTSTTTARPVDYGRPSAAKEVGTGMMEGTSHDGSALYVNALDTALSQRGCEGQPEPLLFRVPVGGGPRQALGPAGEPVRGTIHRGANGRIALVAGCEEFLGVVRIGTETADGQLRDLRRLNLEHVGNTASLAWSGDGKTLVAISRSTEPGGQGSVVRIDPVTGATTPVFTMTGSATQIGQLADGTFVLASAGKVTLRDSGGAVKESVDGVGFTLAPDGRRLAVWGKALRLLTPGQPAATLATTGATDLLGPAQFSPDGTAIAYPTSDEQSGQVAVVTLADAKVTRVPGTGRIVRVFFTGDGRALAYSRLAARPADDAAVVVVRFDG